MAEKLVVYYEQPEIKIKEKIIATVFSYNSTKQQTDDFPFTTANGEQVAKGTIACPSRYSFGTSVEIDGQKFTCNDRMARRYRSGNYFDIWVETREEAVDFGRQILEVKILE